MSPRLRIFRRRNRTARRHKAALRFIPAIQGLEDRKLLSGSVPVAQDGSLSTPHNHAVSGSLAASDPDGGPVTLSLVSGPAHGSLTLTGGLGFTYTPDPDYVGQDLFTFAATDPDGTSAPASETVDVTNQAPFALSNGPSTPHDQPVPGQLLAFDPDGDALIFTLVSGPSHGSLTLDPDGSLFYTPDPHFAGADDFTYAATDPYGASATSTASVQVKNQAPNVLDGHAGTLTDHTVSGSLSASDNDGDPVTVSVVNGPAHGLVTVLPDGPFTYTPDPGFEGQDTFTFQANDGIADSSYTATETIDVANQAQPPVASSQFLNLSHDRSLFGSLVASRMEGDDVTFSLVSGPSHGSLTLDPDGTFTYTPNPGFTGNEYFTFTASNQAGTSAPAADWIFVTNQRPLAGGGTVATLHDHAVSDSLYIADHDGDPLTVSVVTAPSHGSVTLLNDGSFTYTPAPGFTGQDTFTVQANDGITVSTTATETINVTNQAPTAEDHNLVMTHDHELFDKLVVSDGDGDTLTFSQVSGPSHGSLTFNGDGFFTYTPDPGFVGQDSFTFQTSDGIADSNTATEIIDVTNQAPVAYDLSVSTSRYLSVGSSAFYASDKDGDALTFHLVSGPSHGKLTIDTSYSLINPFLYTPDPGYAGEDSFTYTANDGAADSNIATVTIDVASLSPPVALDGNIFTSFYTSDYSHRLNALGATGYTLHEVTFALVSSPSHGTLALGSDGMFTYVPDYGFVGQDNFTFQANDGLADSNIATETITSVDGQALLWVNDGLLSTTRHDRSHTSSLHAYTRDSYGNSVDVTASSSFIQVSSPSHGSLMLDSDGSYTYTPDPGFIGLDHFTFQANDGTTDSNIGWWWIRVENDAPIVQDPEVASTTQDQSVPIALDIFDADQDFETWSPIPSTVNGPAHGTVTATNGSFTYTPDPGFIGQDRFTYKVNDGLADSNIATAVVTVTPPSVILAWNGDDNQDDLHTYIIDLKNGVATPRLDDTFDPATDHLGNDSVTVDWGDSDPSDDGSVPHFYDSGQYTVIIHGEFDGNPITATFKLDIGHTPNPAPTDDATPLDEFETLDWTPVDDALGYEVYRGLYSDGSDGVLLATVASPGYTDTTAGPETSYYYRIVADLSDGTTLDYGVIGSDDTGDGGGTAATAVSPMLMAAAAFGTPHVTLLGTATQADARAAVAKLYNRGPAQAAKSNGVYIALRDVVVTGFDIMVGNAKVHNYTASGYDDFVPNVRLWDANLYLTGGDAADAEEKLRQFAGLNRTPVQALGGGIFMTTLQDGTILRSEPDGTWGKLTFLRPGGVQKVIRFSGPPIHELDFRNAKGDNNNIDRVDNIDVLVEEKDATSLLKPVNKNPDGTLKNTEVNWSAKHIYREMDSRLALLNGVAPYAAAIQTFEHRNPPYSGPDQLLTTDDLRKIKKVKFELAGDWPDLRAAVNADIARLQVKYPNYTFSVTFGGNP